MAHHYDEGGAIYGRSDNGLLIVFEGIDGCGKGTQISLLEAAIAKEGWSDKVVMYKQPGCTDLGNEMRRVLFETVTTYRMEPDTTSLLYLASHIEGVSKVVLPALRAGKIVIADRWDAFSGVTFGRYGLSKPVSEVILNAHRALAGVDPDLLFFLHGDPGTFLARAKGRTLETHQAGKAWSNVRTLTQIQAAYSGMFKDRDERDWGVWIRADEDSAEHIFTKWVWPAVYKAVRRKNDFS